MAQQEQNDLHNLSCCQAAHPYLQDLNAVGWKVTDHEVHNVFN